MPRPDSNGGPSQCEEGGAHPVVLHSERSGRSSSIYIPGDVFRESEKRPRGAPLTTLRIEVAGGAHLTIYRETFSENPTKRKTERSSPDRLWHVGKLPRTYRTRGGRGAHLDALYSERSGGAHRTVLYGKDTREVHVIVTQSGQLRLSAGGRSPTDWSLVGVSVGKGWQGRGKAAVTCWEELWLEGVASALLCEELGGGGRNSESTCTCALLWENLEWEGGSGKIQSPAPSCWKLAPQVRCTRV